MALVLEVVADKEFGVVADVEVDLGVELAAVLAEHSLARIVIATGQIRIGIGGGQQVHQRTANRVDLVDWNDAIGETGIVDALRGAT